MICDECRKYKYCSSNCRARKDELKRIERKKYQEFLNAMMDRSPELKTLIKYLG